jgi:DNA adenine methylase
MNIQKPILKWVGGKTQLLSIILEKIPLEINNYHEPFIGGMSVLLGIIQYKNEGILNITGNIYAYDLNKELIYLYKNIQNFHNELFEATYLLINTYNSIDKLKLDIDKKIKNKTMNTLKESLLSKERYFYWIRNKYNNLSDSDKLNLVGSSMFIFLNKTCFRGLYRVGPRGFNVPFGSYNNPNILDKNHLEIIHQLIKDVQFIHMNFKESLLNISDCDFVYLDPPYVKENETSFVSYNKEGFGENENKLLFELIKNISIEETNKKIMMSNSNSDKLYDIFDNEKYKIIQVNASRRINSKNPESKTTELIIMNY